MREQIIFIYICGIDINFNKFLIKTLKIIFKRKNTSRNVMK